MSTDLVLDFNERGLVFLEGKVTKGALSLVRNKILSEFDRLKLRVNGRIVQKRFDGVPVFQQIGQLGSLIKADNELSQIFDQSLLSITNEYSNQNLKGCKPQLLLSLPKNQKNQNKGYSWHLDVSPTQVHDGEAIQAFVLLDDVSRGGGGTLALKGSHLLPNAKQSILRFKDLGNINPGERFMVDGIEIVCIEMCGRAGDIYLMDMRTLHSPSMNLTKNIRMMATLRYLAF